MKTKITSLLLILSLTICASLHAAPGDTTTVYVHDATDMTWYGGYTDMGYFPDGNTQYCKVLMTYTMGCASTGCSDWDYTTRIEAMIPSGTYDSTVVSIDTITADTTWNVYEVNDPYEMARVITPYGGYMRNSQNGYNNAWKHDYVFDVTDFLPLLKDSLQIRAFYEGWSSGFSASLKFDFIEGTPPRDVISIQNVYKGGGNYASGGFGFEANNFFAKNIIVPTNAEHHKLRVTISGHGFDNNTSCAEFCIRDYYVNVDGNEIGSGTLWRDDCGFNPIYPQGGTWIYDRANWCPGGRAFTHEYDITPHIQGNNVEIDLDMESYFWGGTQAPSYGYSVQLVSYGSSNYANDAAITDIINPSTTDLHKRLNPACGKPTIEIRNEGENPMTSAEILYGVNGSTLCSHTWTGNLAYMETAQVELPGIAWANADTDNRIFSVEITNINGVSDENYMNNTMTSTYEIPEDGYTSGIKIRLRTNNRGLESGYRLTDIDGNILMDRPTGSLGNNQTVEDEFQLDPGCYVLDVYDTGGDGLSWWANTAQGTGDISIRRADVPIIIESFNADFGSQIHHEFTIGALTEVPVTNNCGIVANESPDLESDITISPNPNTGEFFVQMNDTQLADAELFIVDVLGQVVYQKQLNNSISLTEKINLSHLAKGMYMVNIKHDKGQFSEKVMVR